MRGKKERRMKNLNYQAVLFDLDGTLLYTVEDLAAAVNYALTAYGYPSHPVKKVERMVGNGVGKLVERALPNGMKTPDYPQVLETFRSYYSAHSEDHTTAYPGLPELLRSLKEAGVATAIVTNKYQEASEALARRFFPTIDLVAGDQPGRRRKPAPDAVEAALAGLNVPKSRAVYVGDTDVDLETAKNSGLPCISVTWGYRSEAELRLAGAARLVRNAEELKSLLL